MRFKFPDGTALCTNLAFGPLQKLLKYVTEKIMKVAIYLMNGNKIKLYLSTVFIFYKLYNMFIQ